MNPKITIVAITADGVLRECLDSILRQTYPRERLELVVNQRAPQSLHPNPLYNKYENCSRNRNEARTRALKTNADYFLFLDDDVVIPPSTISTFVEQTAARPIALPSISARGLPVIPQSSAKEALGGYYPVLGTNKYVCGRWVADNTFFNFTTIRRGLVLTDALGLGCAFLSRRVLESVSFEPGTNLCCKDAATGQNLIVGECGMFGTRVSQLGLPMYMCGEIVCDHLARPNPVESSILNL